MLLRSNKFYIILISLWTFGIYFMVIKLTNTQVFEEQIVYLQNEVKLLEQQLSQCQKLQDELKRIKHELASMAESTTIHQKKPTSEYEQLRRKLESHTRELFYFTIDQMKKISEKLSSDNKQEWNNVMTRFSDQNRVLLASIRNLTQVDGYQSWRDMEHENLSKLMQTRFNLLQNPSNTCQYLNPVAFVLNERCGFGCQIHRLARCFLIGYVFHRPIVIVSDGWSYNHAGFEQIFQPISKVCNESFVLVKNFRVGRDQFTELSKAYPPRDFLPMAIPHDLAERLIRLHGHPFVWFMGQIIKYLLRPQPWLTDFVEKKSKDFKLKRPIVGVQVRRTDKQIEAGFHNLSEYMKYVEDYYLTYEYQNPNIHFTKRVYLATDDPTVFEEMRTQYPDYVVHGNITIAQSAELNSRYGTESLKGLLLDIHFLSSCDFLVCTFSSQLCRLAYEIMQQRVVDSTWRVQSLDDVYFFENQPEHSQRAVISHQAIWPNEFNFERGDIIHTEGNHWDGFSKGFDITNGLSGLYPTYKIEEIVKIANMYTYPDERIKNT